MLNPDPDNMYYIDPDTPSDVLNDGWTLKIPHKSTMKKLLKVYNELHLLPY